MTTTRRRFAKLVTVAAAAAPLMVAAQSPTPTAPPPAAVPPEPKKESASKPLAAAMAGVLKAEYGEHLDAADLQKIESDLADTFDFVANMRKFKLSNGDEPDAIFSATGRRS